MNVSFFGVLHDIVGVVVYRNINPSVQSVSASAIGDIFWCEKAKFILGSSRQ